jgi:tRNA(fMet)-specific endonuclease VapC
MNPKYMRDTNICTYLMKHQPPEVRERFAQCFVGDVIISAVTLAELEFGIACASNAAQESNRSALESLLDDIKVAPFDAQAAKAYGPIRAAYKDRNRDALDKLIASHAVALGVTLVTNNEADFVNYAGLRVENWVSNH